MANQNLWADVNRWGGKLDYRPDQVIDLACLPTSNDRDSDVAELEEAVTTAGKEFRLKEVVRPQLWIYHPVTTPKDCAMIVPGGGYEFLSIENEGIGVARTLAQRGWLTAVLICRLPDKASGAGLSKSVADFRSGWARFGEYCDERGFGALRSGVVGFSAGGHLTGLSVARMLADLQTSGLPDWLGLFYPVVSFTAPLANQQVLQNLGVNDTEEVAIERLEFVRTVRSDWPSTLIVHAEDDQAVPVQHACELARAIRASKGNVETAIYATGGHGFGVRSPIDEILAPWPELLDAWVSESGSGDRG